jgi:hypothetical protein
MASAVFFLDLKGKVIPLGKKSSLPKLTGVCRLFWHGITEEISPCQQLRNSQFS